MKFSKRTLLLLYMTIMSILLIDTLKKRKKTDKRLKQSGPKVLQPAEPKTNGKQISNEVVITTTDKKNIIDKMNNFRTRVSKGGTELEGQLPKAGNMLKMFWDETLAKKANGHVTSCPPPSNAHSTTQFRTDTSKQKKGQIQGEIVFYEQVDPKIKDDSQKLERNKYNFLNMLDTIEKKTIAEVKKQPFDLASVVQKYSMSSVNKVPLLGDFLQLLNAKTYKVGCDYAACEYDATNFYKVYVCIFSLALKEGSKIYEETNIFKDDKQFDKNLFQSTLVVPKGHANQLTSDDLDVNFKKEIVYQPKI